MKTFQRLFLGLAVTSLVVVSASCSSPAHGPSIQIRDGSWSAEPAVMELGGGSFTILVTNLGSASKEFAVVNLNGADPDALPMRDGALDMRDNMSTFTVVFPEPAPNEGREGGAETVLVAEMLDPDEETQVTIGGFKGGGEPGIYVVMSCEKGRYEAGDYAVFTITG